VGSSLYDGVFLCYTYTTLYLRFQGLSVRFLKENNNQKITIFFGGGSVMVW
jgi:hypothetical protein